MYGLLPSNPCSSSNMSFVRQTLTKMADKMAATYQIVSVCCCGNSNLVIFLWISSNIHIWIVSITHRFKFRYKLCPTNDGLNGRRLPVRTRGHPTLVIYYHIWIVSITLRFKFRYKLCPTNDGLNGRCLPVCTPGHPTLVIYYPIASKFHIQITFIKLSPKFEYGLCQLTKMASKMVETYRFCTCGH